MKIGLQLYSIKDISANEGLEASLRKAHEYGYDCVEFAGFFGLTADEVAALLKKYSLETAGIHQGYGELRADFDSCLNFAKQIGAYSICVPWFNSETVDGWGEFAKEMNVWGKKFREAGILLGYHNHAHEFVALDGKLPIEILLENCDAENVFFQMDTHHVINGKHLPEEYALKYQNRIPVIHVKDNKDGGDCTLGEGCVDFPTVFKNAGKIDVYVVENENFNNNEKELIDSVAYLKSIL